MLIRSEFSPAQNLLIAPLTLCVLCWLHNMGSDPHMMGTCLLSTLITHLSLHTHCAPASLLFLVLWTYQPHSHLRLLPLPVCLPGTLFPQISACLTLSGHSDLCTDIMLLEKALLTLLKIVSSSIPSTSYPLYLWRGGILDSSGGQDHPSIIRGRKQCMDTDEASLVNEASSDYFIFTTKSEGHPSADSEG